MRLPSFSSFWATGLALCCFISTSSGYLNIMQPNKETQFVNNIANAVTWTKGLLDGLNSFDIEMARLSEDGLFLVARNVPARLGKLNLLLLDVPAGDDYFLIFINSTHGVMHGTSPRFTILPPGSTPSSTIAVEPEAATITVSGSPHPTRPFATTFPALANGAVSLTGLKASSTEHIFIILFMTVISGALGAFITVGGW